MSVVVFLHGPAASGKLTVGRALAARTGYPLFHNHLIVDAVGAVFPFGSEAFVTLRQRFWLDTFTEAARLGRPLIFTFAPEPTVPTDFVTRARGVVETHGGVIRFVRLKVSQAEQDRRVENASRAAFNKLRSRDTLSAIRAQAWMDPAPPPADLDLDTEALTPEAAADRIVAQFGLVQLDRRHAQYEG